MQLDSTRSSCLANDGGSKGIDEGGGGYFPQCRQKPGPQKKCKTHFIVKVYAGKAYFLHEDIFFFFTDNTFVQTSFKNIDQLEPLRLTCQKTHLSNIMETKKHL